MKTRVILLLHLIEIISSASNPRLLIISLDGFRHQYLKTYSFDALNRIQNEGIKTKNGMQPTFVTMTYPNHISIATGLYQEDHGIIHNRFFDIKINKTVTFDTRDEGQWSDPKVEPLWITATKQGKKSAVLFWPAAHNMFYGIRPLIYSWVYSDNISLREKIDNVIAYFRENVVDLVMLYHFEPDKQGHIYGPDSNETREALFRLNTDIDYLLNKVKTELNDDLNIILLSDHGMTNIVRVIQPFDEGYIDRSSVNSNILDGTYFSVNPMAGEFQKVFNGLRRIPGVQVYKREEFPKRFRFGNAVNRLGEIIVIPDNEGVVFSRTSGVVNPGKGTHGYDNTLLSMQAIFMAKGPDFNRRMEIDSLKNVDVYHIACKILNLQPNRYATAGSIENLTNIFHTRKNSASRVFLNVSVVFLAIFSKYFSVSV